MILIVPAPEQYESYLSFATENGLGFEVQDLMFPAVMDDEQKAKELLSLYEKAPVVSLHGPFIDLNFSGGDKKVFDITKERIETCASYCNFLGAKKMVLHSCFFTVSPKEDPLYEIWSRTAAELLCEIAEKYDITLCIENVIDRDPDIIKRMVETADHPKVRVCLDVGHANFSMAGIDTWMKALGQYIVHFHLHDNKGYYDEHLAAGDGTVEWKRFFDLEKRLDGDSDMLLEVRSLESTKRSFEFLKDYV